MQPQTNVQEPREATAIPSSQAANLEQIDGRVPRRPSNDLETEGARVDNDQNSLNKEVLLGSLKCLGPQTKK